MDFKKMMRVAKKLDVDTAGHLEKRRPTDYIKRICAEAYTVRRDKLPTKPTKEQPPIKKRKSSSIQKDVNCESPLPEGMVGPIH